MKSLVTIAILISSLFLISSCKKDEDGVERQTTKSYTYSQILRGAEDVRGELVLDDLKLAEVIGADTAQNFRSADLQLSDVYLEVSGLNQIQPADTVPIVLSDFTLKIGSRPDINLGDITTNPQGSGELASDVRHSSNQMINIVQDYFNDLTSGGKTARLRVWFTPNTDINTSHNVRLNLHFRAIYHYETRD